MAKKKRQPVDYYKRYQSEYRKSHRIMGELSKAGYSIDSEYYQDVLSTLNMDYKKAYQTIEQLNKRSKILENAFKIDPETGERIPLIQEQFERLTSVPRSFEYDNPLLAQIDAPRYAEIAVQNFRMELQIYDALIVNVGGATGKSKVSSWFENLLEQYGTTQVGKMLMDASEHGIQLTFEVMYSADSATNFINEMMTFLDTSYNQLDEDIARGIYTEINDGERLAEDEDGNPIL